eukprot:364501-Chlamydomonas_euryale.AAC.7
MPPRSSFDADDAAVMAATLAAKAGICLCRLLPSGGFLAEAVGAGARAAAPPGLAAAFQQPRSFCSRLTAATLALQPPSSRLAAALQPPHRHCSRLAAA